LDYRQRGGVLPSRTLQTISDRDVPVENEEDEDREHDQRDF
jgi:hypothetical protein